MSNWHSEIEDDQIHVAKGFITSLKGTSIWHNERGLQGWDAKGIFPPALALAESGSAPSTENDGDIYLLNNTRGILNVDTIYWQSANTIRYTFNSTPSLRPYNIGDYINFKNSTNDINNGSFVITNVNAGAYWIEVSNLFRSDNLFDEASDSPCTGTSTLSNWDGCDQNSWVRYNAINDKWYSIDPYKSVLCYNINTSHYMIFTGLIWFQINISATGVYDYIILRSTGPDAHRWKFTCDDTGMISMPGEDLGV